MFFAGEGKAGENKNLSVLAYAEVFWWARVDCASRAEKEPGSRLPAAASCLGRHAHPAGRSPNSSSLFLPLAAVVAVAQGLFYPPDCSAGRCCSNPPSRVRLKMPSKTKNQRNFYAGFFGGRGWIRTTEAESSRFTVCPHWPLGNTPIFFFTAARTACICYH